jgi:hypothetical protein
MCGLRRYPEISRAAADSRRCPDQLRVLPYYEVSCRGKSITITAEKLIFKPLTSSN